MSSRRAAQIVLGIYAAGMLWAAGAMAAEDELVVASVLLMVGFLPAVGCCLGVRGCRWIVAAVSVPLLLLWSLSPLMQHEIDRHLGFWVRWTIGETVLGATACAAFILPRKRAPNFTAGAKE